MDTATAGQTAGRHSTRATTTVTETESLLSKLGQGYKRAKAQQILRLLADQESLNQRFKDCALNEDEDDEEESGNDGTAAKKDNSRRNRSEARSNSPVGGVWVKRGLTSTATAADDEKRLSNVAEQDRDRRNEGYLGGSSLVKGLDPTASKPKQKKKKVSSAIDPSRCRTSMGFYNAAECSTSVDGHPELDVEAAANADLELAMGAEADTENRSPRQGIGYLDCETDFMLTAVGARAPLTPRGGPKPRRLFRQQLTQGVTSTVADTIPEESVCLQSARSSSTRPKTGIVGSSARSRQYRRPSRPNPSRDEIESMGNVINHRGFGQPEYMPTPILSNATTTSTTVSKLDPPFTPRGSAMGGIGIRGFCDGSHTPRVSIRDEAVFIPITPRGGGTGLTPRPEASYSQGSTPSHRHNAEPISALFTPRPEQDYSGGGTPRTNGAHDISVPCNTPREAATDSVKALLTPRHTNGAGGGTSGVYASRLNEGKSVLTPRAGKNINFRHVSNEMTNSQNKNELCSSPRRNELSLALTPRQKDHHGLTLANGNECSSGFLELSLTPRNDHSPTSPKKTPRRGEDSGMSGSSAAVVTPRSYNMATSGQWSNKSNLKQSKFSEQHTTFDLNSPRGPHLISDPLESENWGTTTSNMNINGDMISPRKSDPNSHALLDSQRSPRHVSRAVLSIEKNPAHVASTIGSHRHSKGRLVHNELDITTPRRQRVVAAAVAATEKSSGAATSVLTPRGCGDLHRVPVHANLSQRSDRMHPVAVMKLPPLEAAIHKPVAS